MEETSDRERLLATLVPVLTGEMLELEQLSDRECAAYVVAILSQCRLMGAGATLAVELYVDGLAAQALRNEPLSDCQRVQLRSWVAKRVARLVAMQTANRSGYRRQWQMEA